MSVSRTTSAIIHQSLPRRVPASLPFGNKAPALVQKKTFQFQGHKEPIKPHIFEQAWNGLTYVLKRTGAFFNYLGTQIKSRAYLIVGLFAFLPLSKGLRKWVERMTIFPPAKIYDLPFKNADILKSKIQEHYFNMLETVQNHLKGLENEIRFDPKTDNIKLRAWHIPAEENKPTVLFHQQRSSNLSYLGPVMNMMRKKGYGIFVYDYPGYGKSEGIACEEAMYKAGLAASHKLASLKQFAVPINQQIQMGYSLGAPVASHVAYYQSLQGNKPKALVMLNSFPSLEKIIRHNLEQVFRWAKCLISEKAIQRINIHLNCEKFLSKVEGVPTLFLHGKKDRSAPISLVQKMSEGMPRNGAFNQVEVQALPGVYHSLKEKDFETVGKHFFDFMERQKLD
jgi:alpha-beta hydrolase superfamily lysophospholipase